MPDPSSIKKVFFAWWHKRGYRFFPSCKNLPHVYSFLESRSNGTATCQPLEMWIPHPSIARQTARHRDQMECHLHGLEHVSVKDVHLNAVTFTRSMVRGGRRKHCRAKSHAW